MLTRRGWLLASGAVALLFAGRMLGILELFVLAAASGALVLGALVQVRLTTVRLRATRHLHPTRVFAGTDSRVELELANRGARATPVLTVRDPFDRGRRQARFMLGPLKPNTSSRAAYRLPTDRRGVFEIGPLEITNLDSFGLASIRQVVAAATELTVYPALDAIVPLPQTQGHDPLAGADHPTALGVAGEDFYALRAYEMGDDLRRVHWPSTARVDELMIRQNEMPWQGRATVLLDTRAQAHEGDSLEVAVRAAASVVNACWRQGSLVRLVTTDGTDSSFAAGQAHVEAIMERLAIVRAARGDRLASVLGGLRRAGNAGAMVAVLTANVPGEELERLGRLRGRFGSLSLVLIERSAWDPDATTRSSRSSPPVTTLVRVTGDQPFAAAWNRAFAGRRTATASHSGWRP
ncbi:MAG: DUF58 domain-containing protein [Actinobacteria bacterium]|nr:MAG: DUF58 domain-containing protein [Actinomycetota bacterium]